MKTPIAQFDSPVETPVRRCNVPPARVPGTGWRQAWRLRSLTILACLLFPIAGIHAQGAPAQGWAQRVQQAIDAGRYEDAARLLRPAAKAGDPAAMTELAVLHHYGHGVPEDDQEAYRLFGEAARLGQGKAMFWLGRMNLLGYGPPRNNPDADRDAAVWFFKAAQAGHPEGQYYLGLLFMAGTGVDKDADEAMKWIRRAADAGHEPARQFIDGARPAKGH